MVPPGALDVFGGFQPVIGAFACFSFNPVIAAILGGWVNDAGHMAAAAQHEFDIGDNFGGGEGAFPRCDVVVNGG